MIDDRDERLDSALESLQRVEPRPDFTARALDRFDRPSAARRVGPLAWGLGGALAAATLAAGLWIARPEPPPRAAAERLDRLLAEHRELAREVAALRAASESAAPVLYLDGDDDYDLVLDLRPLVDPRSARLSGAALAADDGRAERSRGVPR